jgi:hypothetical protein
MRVLDEMTRGGRVIAAAALVALLAVTVPSGPAAASHSGAPTPAASPAGASVCQVRDDRLTEISGMVATDTGFVVVNDGADEESRRRIFFLDDRCAVVRAVPFPSEPRDTEDLAMGADGTIWVGDIGDNDRTRQSVALWRLAPGADRPVLLRMAYPDRPHDAEALLITADGRPLVVTKGTAELYAPTGALRPGATVPLAKVGQVKLPQTTTSNPYSFVGRGVVTGAATAPGGRRVVLRTYADAFEYDVPDGDVVAALTRGTPRITPLPDEPQGESITYSTDGRSLFTVSESADQPAGARATILRYRPASAADTSPSGAAPTSASAGTRAAAANAGDDHAKRSAVPVAAGIAGAALVVVALVGLLWWRRASRR